ncbi:hypothetical protein GGI11_001759 [Coemansia sp. RSA 2049]|nr:hypothetical protein GGI11_001759 [Coemansia sp. RSA 2049]
MSAFVASGLTLAQSIYSNNYPWMAAPAAGGTTRDGPPEQGSSAPLTLGNVGIGAAVLLFNAGLSAWLKLGLTRGLAIAAARCVVQLTVLSMVLNYIFLYQSAALVLGMTVAMSVLAAVEVTYWRARRRFPGMFRSTAGFVLASVVSVALFGNAYSLNARPAYAAEKFIPVVGMLFGNCVIGVSIGVAAVMETLETHRDRVEAMMCFGASRWELIQPVAVGALKAALLPSITNMGITGLISIPGAMTGWVLGGANVLDAARYQQIIFFMLTASSAIAALLCVVYCASVLIDHTPALRLDRITTPRSARHTRHPPSSAVSRSSTRTSLLTTISSRIGLRRRG